MSVAEESHDTTYDRGVRATNGFLSKVFVSCAGDPKGSVHRAWGLSLLFAVLFFVLSVVEMINLQTMGGSKALVLAAVWTGIIHLVLGVLGTFVLKRFPTSFSVGFLLGVLVVVANQNLILFGTFHAYSSGNAGTNHAFANLMLGIFLVLAFFAAILFHFRKNIVVAAADAKGVGRRSEKLAASSVDYQQYSEQT
ncbi:predicted protein [Phaeodactylum tricornutum CCAP 1055/1]|jgi:lysylphosphatidylglycerol synthetase-like protein (DUF2156 family)|uniref:Uncharacterized protein n=2 Tax=Phaeodactylum tricornutum TaxID=2850 RepID=B7FXM3_PHATC|nr:predicted protein [Phaeodactylum tricornutum CCAP 1055/1]EEC48567.1 predicted protein [Phaeodactylum tricornutum CCAP 1055/1]|eukprot:XP_002179581.1 predicted protein [Phaeodactylum tricornutum CCAP 1055/1]